MSSSRKRLSEGTPQGHRLQDADLLEEHEQAAVIEAAERALARQRDYSKALLALMGVLLAALYLAFAGWQLAAPYQATHQARLKGHLRANSVTAGELAGAATAILAAGAVLCFPGRSWRQLLALAAGLAALQVVYWGVALSRVAAGEQSTLRDLWRLLWLPVVPPTFVTLMALACSTMRASEADLQRLRAARYHYHRA